MSTVDVSRAPRQPSGAAGGVGGQFTFRQDFAPEDQLTESATGSFLYPPERFESTEAYLEFFETAPISDQVLSNATHAYSRWRKNAILAHVHQRHLEYGNAEGGVAQTMARKFGTAGLDSAYQAMRPQWVAEAEQMYPVTALPRSQARAVLRAHQITVQRGMLPEDEEDRALSHLIQYKDQQVRCDYLYDLYSTAEWARDALTESDYAQAEAMNRVASLLAQQQGITDYDDWN